MKITYKLLKLLYILYKISYTTKTDVSIIIFWYLDLDKKVISGIRRFCCIRRYG